MSLDSIDDIDCYDMSNSHDVDEWDLDCVENIEVISEEEARMYNVDRMYNGISLIEAINDIYLDIQDGFVILEDAAVRISTINKIFVSTDSRLERGYIVVSFDGLIKTTLKYKNHRTVNGPTSTYNNTYKYMIIKKVLSLLHEKKQGVLNVV